MDANGSTRLKGIPKRDSAASVLASRISAQDACRRLMMQPQLLRNLCDEYADFISLHRHDGKTYLDALGFSRLQLIHYWRNEGLSADEIRKRLSETRAAESQGAAEAEREQAGESEPPAGTSAVKGLEASIARLSELMAENERKRMEDRDRLLTALMRTQQEIQQLRHEIASRQGRKEKKKRGLFRFLG